MSRLPNAPLVLVLAALALAPPAFAQPRDEAAQSAARTLGLAALELYDKGDYPGALEKFEQAYLVYKAPTLGVGSARCLVKLGKFVAASERYREVAQADLGADATPAFRQAKQDAEREGEELAVRIPKLTLAIEGASADEVTVTLDGRPIDATSLGGALPIDPGWHRAEARRGAAKAAGEVTIAEGEAKSLVLRLPIEKPARPVPPEGGAHADDSGDAGATRRTLGWVAVGVGAAGLVAGGVMTGLTASKKGFLDGKGGCQAGRCPAGTEADVATYNALRVGTTIGFVVGAASGALGVTLLLTAPSRRGSSAGAWTGIAIAPSSIGVRGAF
jgi:hypothetical protein